MNNYTGRGDARRRTPIVNALADGPKTLAELATVAYGDDSRANQSRAQKLLGTLTTKLGYKFERISLYRMVKRGRS